ncbi:MAG: 4Fe-4S dicluster domain-containing protein [Prevotellaceae bacterium]|jgi:heterodisulfide reductase subunit A-like polyferredoxin|nr:4Fe-4S dicluster domain-containing protein [Prevotellaceae bacterium]
MFWQNKNKKIIFVSIDKCKGCEKCTKVCRHRVLTMVKLNDEKRAVANRTDRCSRCGKCIASCSARAIGFVEQINKKQLIKSTKKYLYLFVG